MRGWSLQWRSMNVPELRSGSFSAAAARRPLRLVPPAKRSRLMLHKYLRSRFAPGAPRRKHHRERGYASQSRACSSTGCSSPTIIPGDPREICQTDRCCLSVPEASDERTGFSAGGPRHPRLALCSRPVLGEQPQAGSASPPSPGNAHRTCPGSSLGTKLGCGFRDLG